MYYSFVLYCNFMAGNGQMFYCAICQMYNSICQNKYYNILLISCKDILILLRNINFLVKLQSQSKKIKFSIRGFREFDVWCLLLYSNEIIVLRFA